MTHGALDIAVVILSPLIVGILTVIFLPGWWIEAAWQRLCGGNDG